MKSTPSNWLRHGSIMLLLIALLAGCASLGFKQPEFQLASISMGRTSMLEQEFKVDLLVSNPNSLPLNAQGLHLELEISGKKMATANSTQPVSVPAHGSGHVLLSLHTSLIDLLQQAGKATDDQGRLHYKLNGYLDDLNGLGRIPFSRDATWNMPR
jgi:LEA14-like dessication related protein